MRVKERCSLSVVGYEEPVRTGVRAPIVAKKPGNAGGTEAGWPETPNWKPAETKVTEAGAKGCRKVETQ